MATTEEGVEPCWPKSLCYRGTGQECDPEEGHTCPLSKESE